LTNFFSTCKSDNYFPNGPKLAYWWATAYRRAWGVHASSPHSGISPEHLCRGEPTAIDDSQGRSRSFSLWWLEPWSIQPNK